MGLSGIDACLVEAEQMNPELGAVGRVVRANTALLDVLAGRGSTVGTQILAQPETRSARQHVRKNHSGIASQAQRRCQSRCHRTQAENRTATGAQADGAAVERREKTADRLGPHQTRRHRRRKPDP